MMEVSKARMFCRLLIVLLGLLHASSLVLAKPRGAKSGGTSSRGETPAIFTSRQNLNRGQLGSSTPPEPDRLLADVKVEVNQKMAHVRSAEEFMRVFYPVDAVKEQWTKMVNESVQNIWRGSGRTDAEGADSDRPTFTQKTADEELRDINNHSASVRCGEPSTVLIDMYEELNLVRGGIEYVYPECMKVKRCKNSGCCPGGALCVGKEITRTNISRPFIMVKLLPDSPTSSRYIRHVAYADTECECRGSPRMPTCQPTTCTADTMTFSHTRCQCVCKKLCPRPFIQNPETCDCRCAHKDGTCNKIKRSRRTMADTECTCVAEDRCLQPPCKKGYKFSTRFCKCVQKDESNKRDRERGRDRDRERGRDRDSDRERNRPRGSGRTDHSPGQQQQQQQSDLPPPPRGRTIYGPGTVFLPSSSADDEEPEEDSFSPGEEPQASSSIDPDQEDQATFLVSWEADRPSPTEDCRSPPCHQREGTQGNDNGSGGGLD